METIKIREREFYLETIRFSRQEREFYLELIDFNTEIEAALDERTDRQPILDKIRDFESKHTISGILEAHECKVRSQDNDREILRFYTNFLDCALNCRRYSAARHALHEMLRLSCALSYENTTLRPFTVDELLQTYTSELEKYICVNDWNKRAREVPWLLTDYLNTPVKTVQYPVPDHKEHAPMNSSMIWNPSTECYETIIRNVDYKFDKNHKYVSNSGTAWNGKVNTKNTFLTMTDPLAPSTSDTCISVQTTKKEWPVKSSYRGLEDPRLFLWGNGTKKDETKDDKPSNAIIPRYRWISATSNEVNPNGAQIVLACLEPARYKKRLHTVLLRGIGENKTQKNWVPLVIESQQQQQQQDQLYFIYSFCPLIVMRVADTPHDLMTKTETTLEWAHGSLVHMNAWRGGSPAVYIETLQDGSGSMLYACIVHESNFPKYVSRLVYLKVRMMDREYKLDVSIAWYSPPFSFRDHEIEFCGGLTLAPRDVTQTQHDGARMAWASFGREDHQAWCARLTLPRYKPRSSIALRNVVKTKGKLADVITLKLDETADGGSAAAAATFDHSKTLAIHAPSAAYIYNCLLWLERVRRVVDRKPTEFIQDWNRSIDDDSLPILTVQVSNCVPSLISNVWYVSVQKQVLQYASLYDYDREWDTILAGQKTIQLEY